VVCLLTEKGYYITLVSNREGGVADILGNMNSYEGLRMEDGNAGWVYCMFLAQVVNSIIK